MVLLFVKHLSVDVVYFSVRIDAEDESRFVHWHVLHVAFSSHISSVSKCISASSLDEIIN